MSHQMDHKLETEQGSPFTTATVISRLKLVQLASSASLTKMLL